MNDIRCGTVRQICDAELALQPLYGAGANRQIVATRVALVWQLAANRPKCKQAAGAYSGLSSTTYLLSPERSIDLS